ncbi:molybdopterin molybdotransferase MoeA [Xanthobacter sp. TB0139]|uniref:molybdopterin molybdotransferase MoeA n=1 Tax=Xanthobacter sp. TB0139 TaxID=3459178 RepID=UPI004039EB34
MSVEDALKLILSSARLLEAEQVPVGLAAGRVLAEDLPARRSQPPADMSAMDGYAVRAEDVSLSPVDLQIIGESAAGRPFEGILKTGEAVRIFTGGVMPAGADSVVIQEDTHRIDRCVTINSFRQSGQNVRKMGADFQAGMPGLRAGRRLTARDIMLAAAMDHATVPVTRRPRVALLQTGDELVLPGKGRGSDAEIVVSNAFGLAALAHKLGADVTDLGIVPDDMEQIRAAVSHGTGGGFDLFISSGGASVGEHDLVAPAMRAEGVELHLHKLALKPGKPLMFGSRGQVLCLGLPGNPVSSHVCSILFMAPLLRAMQGEETTGPETTVARLAVDMPPNGPRRDFMRATFRADADGALQVTPASTQDSAMLSLLATSNCLLVRPPHACAAQAGDSCEILPFSD